MQRVSEQERCLLSPQRNGGCLSRYPQALSCWVVYANVVVKWASLGSPGAATKLPESRAQRGG